MTFWKFVGTDIGVDLVVISCVILFLWLRRRKPDAPNVRMSVPEWCYDDTEPKE